jgi:surfactin synthase thioesterase subunit
MRQSSERAALPMHPTTPLSRRWLARSVESGCDVLFCLPRLGYGPAQFDRWPRMLAGRLVRPLRFPGDRDAAWWPAHPGFREQATDLLDDLADLLADRYALFAPGGSGLLAFEAVREAARRGLPTPDRLVVSGSPPPSCPPAAGPEPGEDSRARDALVNLLELGGNPLPSLVENGMRALGAEHRALATHRPQTALSIRVPVTAVAWSEDPYGGPEVVKGWAGHAETDLLTLDGGPRTFATAPGPLLAALESVLAGS